MKRFYTLILLIPFVLVACRDGMHQRLLSVEQLVTTHADSALQALDSIAVEELTDEGNRALYDMLHTWALYRTYAPEIPEEPLDGAFNFYTRSVPCTTMDSIRSAQVYYLRSVVHQDQKRGEHSEWVEDMYQAALLVEGTPNHLLAAMIFQRYAAMLYDISNYAEAAEWNKKYLHEAALSGNHGEEITAHINLALSQYGENKDDDAIKTIQAAIRLARLYGMPTEEGKCYGNLSVFYSHKNLLDSALVYALKAKDIDEQQYRLGQRRDRVRYIHVAEAYRRLNRADSALYYAQLDLDNPSIITRRNAAQLMYIIYNEVVHDYQKSLQWMQRHKLIEDSIHLQRETQQMDANKSVVNAKKAEEAATQLVHRTQWWIYVVAIVAVLIIVAIVVVNRRRYQRKLQEQEERFNQLLRQQSTFESSYSADGQQVGTTLQDAATESVRRSENAEQCAATEQLVASNESPVASNVQSGTSDETPAAPNVPPVASNVPPVAPNVPPAASSDSPVVSSEQSGVSQQSASAAAQSLSPSKVILSGTTKEHLDIPVDRLVYVVSEGNYINVSYISATDQVKQKMLRQTMTAMETMLQPYHSVVRCHRAYFVNLQHVVKAQRSSSGLILTLDVCSDTVPVSKTYISRILQSLGKD